MAKDQRNMNNKNDVREILDIINKATNTHRLTNFIPILWYMSHYNKIVKSNLIEEFNLIGTTDIFNACEQLSGTISMIKESLSTQSSENTDGKSKMKIESIYPVVQMSRIVFSKLAYEFNGFEKSMLAFMYAMYMKSRILDIHDILKLEETVDIQSVASISVVMLQCLKNIDKGVYLDREKFPVVIGNLTTGSTMINVVTIDKKDEEVAAENSKASEISSSNIIASDIDTEKKEEEHTVKETPKTEEEQYVNRYIPIYPYGAPKSKNPRLILDMLKVYNDYIEGFSQKELAELYDVSDYTISVKIRDFVKANNLPIPEYRGRSQSTNKETVKADTKPTVNIIEKPKKKAEDDCFETEEEKKLFEKAQLENSKLLNSTKSQCATIINSVERKFVNYALEYIPGTRERFEIPKDVKKRIAAKGVGGYYRLNDGQYYYVTPEYLIFRNLPKEEELEKYRAKVNMN